jgi:hypothetical protein
VRTVAELVSLVRSAGALWWRFLSRMTFWYALGFLAHQLGNYVSVLLGARHNVTATLVFVVGLVGLVAALVLTIQSCVPAVRGRQAVDGALGPAGEQESRLEVLSMTLGPFLAVYALWGLIADEVSSLFIVNIMLTGLGGVDEWSVNLRWIRFYLILALVAWLVRQLLAAINRHAYSAWLLAPTIVAEGLWVVASFLAAFGLGRRALVWLEARQIWQDARERWYQLLGWLPDLRLPFDLTLPRAVAAAVDWVWATLLPGLATAVLLPLVWLALTATVFGRRRFTARGVVAGTGLQPPVDRWGRRLTRPAATPLGRLAVGTGNLLTADLRTKYVPVLHALRWTLGAGARFLGAYLVVAAVVQALPRFSYAAVDRLVGPQGQSDYLARQPVTDFAIGWLATTLAVAVYVAAFVRVADISGGTRPLPRPTLSPSAR